MLFVTTCIYCYHTDHGKDYYAAKKVKESYTRMHRSKGENHPHKMKYIPKNLNTIMRLIEMN